MILPTIYEDAISCFCPRTAKMMRRYVWNYLSSGQIPAGLARFGKAPIAMLNLIFSNIELYNLFVKDKCNQIAPPADKCNQVEPHSAVCHHAASPSNKGNQKTNVSDKFNQVEPPEGFNQVEDETKEKLSDEKNKTLLPPTPPINKTIKAENGKEKKEEMCVINACARENSDDHQKIQPMPPVPATLPTENTEKPTGEIMVARADEKSDLETCEDVEEEKRMLRRRRFFKEISDKIMQTHPQELIDFYNRETKGKLPPVTHVYPDIVLSARIALADIGMEKACEVIRIAMKDLFLLGDNRTGFVASFRWIFEDKHYYKILNGEFHDRKDFDFGRYRREQEFTNFYAKRHQDLLEGKRPAAETTVW